MMAHTPGRWELVWFRGKGSVARIRLNGSTVYQVSDVTDPEFPSGTPRYNLDDLRLMSAAPELLAALKAIEDDLLMLDGGDFGHSVKGWRDMDATSVDSLVSSSFRLASDAIAKAEGSA
jgi:hypothetical protein